MSSLVIVKPERPIAIVASSGLANPNRLLSPDPKEAAIIPQGGVSLTIDYGVDVLIDTAFIGFNTAKNENNASWAVVRSDANGVSLGDNLLGDSRPVVLDENGEPRHSFWHSEIAMSSRYWQYQISNGGPAYLVGTLALGLAFQPEFGREYGSGRTITDTSTVDRLFGGGFGIDYGVTAGGFQWTMGDLTDAEVSRLYRLARNRGVARSLLVVEDPDQTEGLNERIHWGLFQRFEKYERFAPGATRWSMAIEDWA